METKKVLCPGMQKKEGDYHEIFGPDGEPLEEEQMVTVVINYYDPYEEEKKKTTQKQREFLCDV